jgi:hypothetical protein
MAQTPSRPSLDELDDSLSQRFIHLDPAGYFLIRVDAGGALRQRYR